MTYGNYNSKVAECLYVIRLVHEARSEFKDSFHILYQALETNKKTEDVDDDSLVLAILHRIGVVYQPLKEVEKSKEEINIMSSILRYQVSANDLDDQLFGTFEHDNDENHPQVASAA